jgi:hypothetical protein
MDDCDRFGRPSRLDDPRPREHLHWGGCVERSRPCGRLENGDCHERRSNDN